MLSASYNDDKMHYENDGARPQLYRPQTGPLGCRVWCYAADTITMAIWTFSLLQTRTIRSPGTKTIKRLSLAWLIRPMPQTSITMAIWTFSLLQTLTIRSPGTKTINRSTTITIPTHVRSTPPILITMAIWILPVDIFYNGVDNVAPTITGVSLAADNASIAVTMSEAVYNTNGGSGNLEATDFSLSISGGNATLASSNAIQYFH